MPRTSRRVRLELRHVRWRTCVQGRADKPGGGGRGVSVMSQVPRLYKGEVFRPCLAYPRGSLQAKPKMNSGGAPKKTFKPPCAADAERSKSTLGERVSWIKPNLVQSIQLSAASRGAKSACQVFLMHARNSWGRRELGSPSVPRHDANCGDPGRPATLPSRPPVARSLRPSVLPPVDLAGAARRVPLHSVRGAHSQAGSCSRSAPRTHRCECRSSR